MKRKSDNEDSNESKPWKRLKEGEIKESLEKLADITNCPVCFGNLPPSIVSCINGHVVCHNCRTKLKICPMCKAKFSAIKLSCLSQILEELPRICIHDGCSLAMKNITEHDKWCKERLANCRIKNCSWNGSVKNLLAHLKQDHPLRFLTSDAARALSPFPTFKSLTAAHLYHDIFFWRTTTVDHTRGRVTFMLTCVPTEEIRDTFQLKIKFESTNLTYKAKTVLKLVNEGGTLEDNVLKFDLEELNHFVDEEGKLSYNIQVDKFPGSV